MKKWLMNGFVLLLIFMLLVGCADNGTNKKEGGMPELVVGATYGLTGPVAIYSETVVNAIKLVKEDIKNSGKLKMNVILEDDRSDKNEAINLYQKFIDRDKSDIIIGPLIGNQVFAATPIAQDAKIPVMLTTVATPGVTDIGDFVFRTSGESPHFIPKAVKAAVEHFNVKKVAVIHAKDDEFAIGEYKAFKSSFEKEGVKIVDDEVYLTGDIDFSSQLTKIKASSPDIIAIAAQAEEVVAITTQARQLGIDVSFIGGNAFNASNTLKEAGSAMEGSISATPWFIEMETEENKQFVEKYRNKFGKDPDWLSAQTYDALQIIAKAYLEAGITSKDNINERRIKLRDAIAKIKEYKGVLGTFGFTKNGDPTVSGTVIIVKDGKHMLFKP
ncbi:ABC transporter substrate-binding protein [Bacillus sp. 1P10SD]|uniref:ABC transporter substrate-binding protein n=1 Tax=Bacillus sp. 1P10SD TaxID=3132265 RepID=UPI0039A73AFE